MEKQVNVDATPEWSPSSWRSKHVAQDVIYEHQDGLEKAVKDLEVLPPLVTPTEVIKLRNQLSDVAMGRAFLLQGGDCAELFDYCRQDMIEAKLKLLLQMSFVMIHGAKKKVVRIVRGAGQYAKPRSSPMETVNGVEMPSFRGENINGFEPTLEIRKPDPSRLVDAYKYSSITLNYLRAALSSGIADLHSPLDWSLGHVKDPKIKNKYAQFVRSIVDSLDFMRVAGIGTSIDTETVDVFTSHEGLLLEYEQALTRLCRHPPNHPSHPLHRPHHQLSANSQIPSASSTSSSASAGYYALSSHFLWIGDRTRSLTGAHVEFFRNLQNPIGVKVGPTMPASDLPRLLSILDPDHQPGKVTLITRYGASKISAHLPDHIRAVRATPHLPVWQCDPMHGNTRTATLPSGEAFKTRRFTDVLEEVRLALEIHEQEGSVFGGVHLELTGEPVTECVGGAGGLREEDLSLDYRTFCDPRLNEKQALELAFLMADWYGEARRKKGEV